MTCIVGIDLGTTNSEVAIIKDNAPEVILVDGQAIMPSCVGLNEQGELMVGRSARNQMVAAPDRTILSIKRQMGKIITVALGDKSFTPEEISSFILKKLKTEAEAYLGESVTQAVITVPAYFDDNQRKATRNAGILAGLEVLRIINEPTAAALTYDNNLENNQMILVYDLGGGTFDASLVVAENGVVEVKASHGDTHLGGDDFDRLIMEYLAKGFLEKHHINLMEDNGTRNRLWSVAEKAKQILSDAPFVQIREEYIHGDFHLNEEISRMDYEEMIRPFLRKTMDSVHRCLKDAAVLPKAVDKVILVGGATRTPLVSEMIREHLGIEPRFEINPDLIVAMGAAIQAGVINGQETRSVLVDITPYTFGTSAFGEHNDQLCSDLFVPIIKRNTPLPIKKGEGFATMVDGQKAVDVRIYQGEAPLAADNIFIGNFLVEGLSDVPAGNEIVLNLGLDLNGILEVTAVEKQTGLSKTVRMETGEKNVFFDIDKARKNISEFLSEDEQKEEMDPTPGGRGKDNRLLNESKELKKRAQILMKTVDETDAAELRALIDQSKKAVSEGNLTVLAELNESLSDMLFYLED